MRSNRKMTLQEAKARFPHRFTMEHRPVWAARQADNGKFYAPQYSSDREWYENTFFKGEEGYLQIGSSRLGSCYTTNQSWPLGMWLNEPFQVLVPAGRTICQNTMVLS